MERKDKEKFTIIGGIAGIIVLVFAILATQAYGARSSLEAQIKGDQKKYNEIRKLAGEYAVASAKLKSVESKMADNSPLLSYVETLTRNAGVSDPALKVIRTTPNEFFEENTVELKIKEINLRKLTGLLNLIENSQRYLRVKFFQMKTPYARPDLVELTMHISAFTKKAQEANPGGIEDINETGIPTEE